MLTINQDLQEIAENALMDAIAKMGATSGDIVILDPHSGEIRAMASRRGDSAVTAAAITEPFEPGSTLKPFIAAGLLERGLVKPTDSVDTGNGLLTLNSRTIHDDHPLGRVPLSDVIRMSSNVGIVKFAERLSPGDEFETLRDFGFGTSTGIEFPSEAGGSLRAPNYWGSQSPNSIAMGYEVAVTPLQLAVAYAVFANGGKLLEPTLVKEVRSPDGKVRYRHTTHVVRQVISESVALDVREMLREVVQSGTASAADMDTYVLAGKTGTPRGTVNGHYVAGKYNPNFVGLFPADDPQYVIAVRLSNPIRLLLRGKDRGAGDQGGDRGGGGVASRRARPRPIGGERAPDAAAPRRAAGAPGGFGGRAGGRNPVGRGLGRRAGKESSPEQEPVVVTLPVGLADAPSKGRSADGPERPWFVGSGRGADVAQGGVPCGLRRQQRRRPYADRHGSGRWLDRATWVARAIDPISLAALPRLTRHDMTVSLDTIAKAFESQRLLVDRRGVLPETVTLVTDDSRKVRPGSLFVAVRGADRDGHAYLADAEKAGAPPRSSKIRKRRRFRRSS